MQIRTANSAADADVVVIGGGVAGLSAATSLAARGARVVVLEARPALGGRASSYAVPAAAGRADDAAVSRADNGALWRADNGALWRADNGALWRADNGALWRADNGALWRADNGALWRADNGQHILMGCYHETFAFLRRVGVMSKVAMQNGLAADSVDADGHWSRLSCPALPSPFNLLAGLWRWPALSLRDRLSALRLATRGAPLASETVQAWLARLGQTPRLIEMLWEPLAIAALNQPIGVAAAAPFAEVIDRMLRSRNGASLALPQVPLDELFAHPARAFIESHGGLVRTQTPARLVFDRNAASVHVGDERLTARAVIAAVEWNALERLCADPPVGLRPIWQAAAATAASAIVSAHLWLDRRVLDVPFVGLPRRPWQWVFDVGATWGAPTQLSFVASAADGMPEQTNEALIESALAILREVTPKAREATLQHGLVVRERRATFSVAPNAPPRPGNQTDVPGFFLAGDWIGTRLPATIESAATSGHAAAQAAARHLSL